MFDAARLLRARLYVRNHVRKSCHVATGVQEHVASVVQKANIVPAWNHAHLFWNVVIGAASLVAIIKALEKLRTQIAIKVNHTIIMR